MSRGHCASDAVVPPRAEGWLAASVLSALGHTEFRRLWAAHFLSHLGTTISRVALVMHLASSANSIAAIGALVLFESLPGSVTAFVSGAIVDRTGKRWLMIATDVVRAALVVCVLLWPLAAVIYAATAAASVATAFFLPARAAAVPMLVPPALLTRANAMDQATTTIVMVLGPAAGAYLYLDLGLGATLAIDALSFLASAAILVPLRIRSVAAETRGAAGSTIAQVRDGWRYLTRHGIVRHLVGATALSLLCVGLWMPVAPAFLRGILPGVEGAIGYQLTLFGLGGLAGSILAPHVVRRWGKGPVFSFALLAEAAAMLLYSVTPTLVLSNAIICLWGAIISLMLVPYYSLMQATVAEDFLGRVFAVARQSESLATVLAVGAAALLQRWLEPRGIFLVAGCAYLAIASVALGVSSGRQLLRAR